MAVLLLASIAFQSHVFAIDRTIEKPVRWVEELEDGWRFYYSGHTGESSAPTNKGDHLWQPVRVPHNWNRVGYYTNELVEHLNNPDNINKRQGVGWYRLSFSPHDISESEKLWLEFDAVSRTANVWLNGEYIGEHRGGFSRFRFDITKFLVYEQPNQLLVKVDNSKPEPNSSTADVLPIDGDFFVHGGIYRPVRLVKTSSTHFDMRDFGGPGVYVTTQLEDDSAVVRVRSRVSNEDEGSGSLTLVSTIIDAAGKHVAIAREPIDPKPGATSDWNQSITLENPHLWHGVIDPYLYTIRSEIYNKDGDLLDYLDQKFGIRVMHMDPQRGFFLNGQAYPLKGVAYHQDREGKGWAVSREDTENDIQIIREMGANTIRLAHYQHGQSVHDLANQHGLILWDEIPLVSSWSYGPEHKEINNKLAENARLQLREMIRQNFNHPSVAVWGIANEVDFAAILPKHISGKKGHEPLLRPLIKSLNALAKSEDQSRPSAIANCCELRDGLNNPEFTMTGSIADVAGANRYFGWYYGTPAELGPHLDKTRTAEPDKPLAVTEYGAGGATSQYSDNPRGGHVEFAGVTQPERYMTWFHEENWKVLSAKPYLWATWIWNAFDFATTTRKEGDSIDINTKGLVTYDRNIKKDAYYFYKANWYDSPTVYITDRRYVKRAYPVTDIRVYSNADETELWLNEKYLGEKGDCKLNICTWRNVRLQSGENKLRAVGHHGSGFIEDSVAWKFTGRDTSSYYIDVGSLVAAESSIGKFGSDNFFTGGQTRTIDTQGGWGKPVEKTPVSGTKNRDLLATYREGEFQYSIPVENGRYRVTLFFIEPSMNSGERTFDVVANGKKVITMLDVAAKAGRLRELSRTFEVNSDGGNIELLFEPVKGEAILSAMLVDKRE